MYVFGLHHRFVITALRLTLYQIGSRAEPAVDTSQQRVASVLKPLHRDIHRAEYSADCISFRAVSPEFNGLQGNGVTAKRRGSPGKVTGARVEDRRHTEVEVWVAVKGCHSHLQILGCFHGARVRCVR